jgi:putative addiction module killer protein
VIEARQTTVFRDWMADLNDIRARARIADRIDRLTLGNPGDVKSVGDGVSELRIDYGPGYRLYFTRRGQRLVLLLCGGDKSTQNRDIDRAKALVRELKHDG